MSNLPLSTAENLSTHQNDDSAWVVVPIDGSECAVAAINLAVTVARIQPSKVVLAGIPSMNAAECGAEERRVQTLRRVLMPLQRRLQVVGITTAARILHSDDPAAELRMFIAGAPRGSVLVLANPYGATGALRDLASDLACRPPCTLYVTRPPQDYREPRRGLVAWLIGTLRPPMWPSAVCTHHDD